jgi:uncharacterized protein YbjT (DUF2867 family)
MAGPGVGTGQPSVDRLARQHDASTDSDVRYLASGDRLVQADLTDPEPLRELAHGVRGRLCGPWG